MDAAAKPDAREVAPDMNANVDSSAKRVLVESLVIETDEKIRQKLICNLHVNEIQFGSMGQFAYKDIVNVATVYTNPNALTIRAYVLEGGKRVERNMKLELEDPERSRFFRQELERRSARKRSPHRPKNTSGNKLLILINPYSGQKRALQLWNNHVIPIFEKAEIDFDVVFTESVGHGTQIAEQLDLEEYDGVGVVSGDGLVSEVIAGFLRRNDRERALKVPILHIPGGTGNALAASICYHCNEPFSARDIFCFEAALMATRPRYLPLRILHVETEHDGHKPMFLSAVWGLIADIDLGSERFRWAGMIRLHMEAFIRITRLPSVAKYKARVSYKHVKDKQLLRSTKIKASAPREAFGDGHFDYEDVEPFTGGETKPGTSNSFEEIFDGSHCLEEGHLPTLDERVPNDWEVIEGEFAYVCLSASSHLGSDLPYMPSQRLNDEVFYLTLIDWNTIPTRFHVAMMMITIDRGAHLDYPFFQVPYTLDRLLYLVSGNPSSRLSGRTSRR
ncbi:hypothetical protein L596_011848 [Steinernema carpocapsae]|uniref:DAGKc domain-containing protein n=1 Tax=Steinernema carpocapsae TaxID=34508 RepID=A0A4U5NW43_STECR|nr:hypothetical protein L596_011848 [Steinernema carpocapsae]